MKLQDYRKAAQELWAHRVQLRYERYVVEYTRTWMGMNGHHMGLSIGLSWNDARTMAKASAKVQIQVDIHLNRTL